MTEETCRRRILVVEDNSVYRQLLLLALSSEGYEVEGAENGVSALVAVERNIPDLIILDLLMPVLDGLSFLRTLKEEKKIAVPTLVLTCLDERACAVDVLVAGASDVLRKPVRLDDLLRKIEALL